RRRGRFFRLGLGFLLGGLRRRLLDWFLFRLLGRGLCLRLGLGLGFCLLGGRRLRLRVLGGRFRGRRRRGLRGLRRRGRFGARGFRRGSGLRTRRSLGPGLRLAALGEDLRDADHRELLAVTNLAARVLAAALLERDDLFA